MAEIVGDIKNSPVTAFIVVIDAQGNAYLDRATDHLAFEVERPATMLEVRRFCSEIVMDLQAQAAAEYTRLSLTMPAPNDASQ